MGPAFGGVVGGEGREVEAVFAAVEQELTDGGMVGGAGAIQRVGGEGSHLVLLAPTNARDGGRRRVGQQENEDKGDEGGDRQRGRKVEVPRREQRHGRAGHTHKRRRRLQRSNRKWGGVRSVLGYHQ